MRVVAKQALLPEGLQSGVVLDANEDGTIRHIRPSTAADGPANGVLLPGLVNAHTHVELGWAAGLVPGGKGLPAWVAALRAQLAGGVTSALDVTPLVDAGTAVVCDVSNGGDTAGLLDAAGLVGIVQHEMLGFSQAALSARIALASRPPRQRGGMWIRSSPHAVYSTPPALIAATAAKGPVPASIHVAEDPSESVFTLSGEGPWAEFLDQIGVDWRWWEAPGLTPVGLLGALGLLGPDLLLVHGVHLTAADRAAIAAAGASICLCPRSNLHIGGVLPDVPALLGAGVRLCLGTDALASCPDLDVLGEVTVLMRAFPEVPVQQWLTMATGHGADALGFSSYGRLRVGTRPGLVLLQVDAIADAVVGPIPRRVLGQA